MKKNLLALIVCVAVLFAFCSCDLFTKFTFEENADGYTFTGVGDSTDTEIVVPETYKGKPVTAIGNKAFYYNVLSALLSQESATAITSITLPESITSIGSEAFANNASLTTLNIPSSVKTIGAKAFLGCSSLTSITIPEGVTEIGAYTFQDCTRLTSITLPSTITRIDTGAFSGCSSLQSITLPDGVTEISPYCFEGCTSLTGFTISENIVGIWEYAFSGCKSLGELTVPSTVTTLGGYVFSEVGENVVINVSYDSTVPEGWDEYWLNGASGGKILNTSEVYYTNVVVPNQAIAEGLQAKIDACNEQYKELQEEYGQLNEASKPYQASGNSTMIKHYRDLMKENREQQSSVLNKRDEYREQFDALKITNQVN